MSTVYEPTPPESPARLEEPPIVVRAEHTGVIIQPHPGRLDSGATAALVLAINAASGATALSDLTSGLSDQSPRVEHRASQGRGESPVARLAGPGMVEFAAGAEPWLLDVVGRRLSRVHADDRRFLPASAWLRVQAVTVSAAIVGATTDAGDRIAVHRSM
jgi:hypothetical protein